MQTQKNKQTENLRLIPLGGLGEVGRNMSVLEYKNQILIIDMGFRMPEEDMHGIDYIIPNAKYLRGKEKNILGVVFTHGHYDHIGAVPYLAKNLGNPPMYASALTKGIILKRQEDFPDQPKPDIIEIKHGSKIKLGPFEVEFVRMNHNIPDNLGLFIETPVGNIFHTSDFKFDDAPVNELPTDFKKLKELGKRKVLLLMSDSTGAEEENHSLSEQDIQKNLEKIFIESKGRIIAATFASLINRIQQLIALSEKYNRRVIVEGYSMKTNVEICRALGYMKIQKGTLVAPQEMKNLADSQITFICTGAQGEEKSTLNKITNNDYPFLRFKKEDTVVLSSSVIPGNERTVQFLKDRILQQGAQVYHYKMMDIHAGGHAQREELKEMITMMRPKFFMPIHGQYSMLVNHAQLANSMGIPEKNIVVAENGKIINISPDKIFIKKDSIPCDYVMVDGLGIGDVGEIVLRDRQVLAQDGMFVIVVLVDKKTGKVRNSPDIISRGFVYLRESRPLLAETRKKVIAIINKSVSPNKTVNWTNLKEELKKRIGEFLFHKTQRRPMILPVIIEVD